MEQVIKTYKRRFRNSLEPIMVMFIKRKTEMTVDEWQEFIYRTRSSILKKPHEFLGLDLPDESTTHTIVNDLFTEFLKTKS
jgi:hypothetical protein